MNALQLVLRTLARSIAALCLCTAGLQAIAQTQDQIRIFQSLPPEQQQEILQTINGHEADSQPLPPAAPTSVPKVAEAAGRFAEVLQAEPRLRAGDMILLAVGEPPEGDRASSEFRARILAGNPYNLDRVGRLVLPDAMVIVLAGLTADEAATRLNADPHLAGYDFGVRLLPVEPELKPFGYDLFRNVPTTFAPATDIPVPAEYVVGPGDTFEVQLIGDRGGRYSLIVGRDGNVDFPELGPIAVSGMRFVAAREMLEQRVAEQLIGMRASVAMGALRSIQVFVLGDAERPGSYTVSGLSTITNALFTSGGVKPIGSLRNIELKRSGRTVTRFDLYDLLLNGDTSNDTRLLPGDVIFIPPVGVTVAVAGEVQRPAIYELRERASAADVLYLAGGLTPRADPRTAVLERIDGQRNLTILDLNLTTPQGRATPLQTGDRFSVQAIRESLEDSVTLVGHVYRSGSVRYRPGMRLKDLIGDLDELRPLADLRYALIRRESGPTRTVSTISADPKAAFADPASEANVLLQARDRVHVFDLASSRERVVKPILDDLLRQSSRDEPLQVVGVGGRVKVPGQYPLETGMTIGDLVRAGGGLDQAAYGGEAELTRYEVVEGERRQTDVVRIDLAQLLAGSPSADLALRPYDFLVIKEIPLWRDQETITISGEVLFPGSYPIKRGETLGSVIQRAGGLTDQAYPAGSVFMRAELKAREQRQLEVLAERMQRELAALSLQQAQSESASSTNQAITAGQALLADLRTTEAVGRLVIDLEEVMKAAPESAAALMVRDGDQLLVPRLTQEVTVIGEVQNPTSHLFNADLNRDEYIAMSGGLTQRGDDKRTFIIRANGSVAAAPAAAWFSRSAARNVLPGDTIVVPLDAQQMRPLTVWTSVTQILYHIAVAVAAVNSF